MSTSPAVSLSGSAYGVPLTIQINDRRWMELVTQHLPFGWSSATPDPTARRYALELQDDLPQRPGTCHVGADGATVVAGVGLAEALRRFESDARLHVAELATGRLFVHAGVVAYGGRAIVLPGRSFSGKSTLVAELVRAGAVYYSDEYAVLDDEGRIHPYAAPLSIRSADGTGTRRVAVETLGARPGSDVIPVGFMIACRYRPGAEWRPLAVSPGQSMLRLLANTIAVRRSPAYALVTLRRAMETAHAFFAERGDAQGAAQCILTLVDTASRGD